MKSVFLYFLTGEKSRERSQPAKQAFPWSKERTTGLSEFYPRQKWGESKNREERVLIAPFIAL